KKGEEYAKGSVRSEGQRGRKVALRQVQDHPARAADPCDLLRAEAQAAAGLERWLVSPVLTSPARNGSTSRCATSSASGRRRRARCSSRRASTRASACAI